MTGERETVGDTKTIRVMITVDTDELREWAGKHADAGRHGVAHALYESATRYEAMNDTPTPVPSEATEAGEGESVVPGLTEPPWRTPAEPDAGEGMSPNAEISDTQAPGISHNDNEPDAGERERERLGRIVRDVWIEWAQEQPTPKASWLVPWEGLSEPDREVDRRIGERLATEGRPVDPEPLSGPARDRRVPGDAPARDGGEVEALAKVIEGAENPRDFDGEGVSTYGELAAAVLASDWLAARDARVRREGEADGLRAAAEAIERDCGNKNKGYAPCLECRNAASIARIRADRITP